MDVYISTIMLWPTQWFPSGWAPCNGQLLPVRGTEPLFSLIGSRYGGDGQVNFALPKLASPGPGLTYIIAVQGLYPPRD